MLFEERKILRILLEQIFDGIECFGLDLERVVDFEFAEEERADSADFHAPDVLEELREEVVRGLNPDSAFLNYLLD